MSISALKSLMTASFMLAPLSIAADPALVEPAELEATPVALSQAALPQVALHKGALPEIAPPKLGQHIPLDEVRSITIWPDGKGLPAGSGQAATGQVIYTKKCQACHGQGGQGGLNDALVGGQTVLTQQPNPKTIGSYWPYATSLFDYVRRAMPYREPGSLSNDEVYAVVAYLLFVNGMIKEELILDAARLSQLKLPNRQRFYSEYKLP